MPDHTAPVIPGRHRRRRRPRRLAALVHAEPRGRGRVTGTHRDHRPDRGGRGRRRGDHRYGRLRVRGASSWQVCGHSPGRNRALGVGVNVHGRGPTSAAAENSVATVGDLPDDLRRRACSSSTISRLAAESEEMASAVTSILRTIRDVAGIAASICSRRGRFGHREQPGWISKVRPVLTTAICGRLIAGVADPKALSSCGRTRMSHLWPARPVRAAGRPVSIVLLDLGNGDDEMLVDLAVADGLDDPGSSPSVPPRALETCSSPTRTFHPVRPCGRSCGPPTMTTTRSALGWGATSQSEPDDADDWSLVSAAETAPPRRFDPLVTVVGRFCTAGGRYAASSRLAETDGWSLVWFAASVVPAVPRRRSASTGLRAAGDLPNAPDARLIAFETASGSPFDHEAMYPAENESASGRTPRCRMTVGGRFGFGLRHPRCKPYSPGRSTGRSGWPSSWAMTTLSRWPADESRRRPVWSSGRCSRATWSGSPDRHQRTLEQAYPASSDFPGQVRVDTFRRLPAAELDDRPAWGIGRVGLAGVELRPAREPDDRHPGLPPVSRRCR